MRRSTGCIKRPGLSEVGVSSRLKGGELWKELPRRLCCGSAFSLPSLVGFLTSTGGADIGPSASKDRGCVMSAGGFGGAKGAVFETLRIVVAAITEGFGGGTSASGGDDTSTGGGGGRGLDSSEGSSVGVRVRGDTDPEARGEGDSGGEKRDGSSTAGGDGDDPGAYTPVGPRICGGVGSRGTGESVWLRLPSDENVPSMVDTESFRGTGLRLMLARWDSGATSCKYEGREQGRSADRSEDRGRPRGEWKCVTPS